MNARQEIHRGKYQPNVASSLANPALLSSDYHADACTKMKRAVRAFDATLGATDPHTSKSRRL